MPRALYMNQPESLIIEEAELPPLAPDRVRVRAELSAIKHGTDLHILSGKSPFQNMRFDTALRLFVEDEQPSIALNEKRPFGNTTVGVVEAEGDKTHGFRPGDRVFAYAPIAEVIDIPVLDPYLSHLPAGMSAEDALCMDPAFFAYGAIRDAGAKPGDTAVVFGIGAIGAFIVQLLRLSGCLHIIAFDPIAKRRELALASGASAALDPLAAEPGLAVRELLAGHGADIVIEASGHYGALRSALRCARQNGKVVTVGYYKGNDPDLALGREWHHNQLTLVSSLPVWGNPMRDYPLWDESRARRALMEMFVRGMLSSRSIIDPIVPFEEAPEAILRVYRNPADSNKLGVVYPPAFRLCST